MVSVSNQLLVEEIHSQYTKSFSYCCSVLIYVGLV